MNYAFSAIFIIEMLVKWSAHGFFGYWRQPLNCFDGILVGLIVIEYAFTEMSVIANNDLRQELLDANPNMTDADAGDTQELGIVGAGRSLRILRFFRIVRTLRVFRLYRAFHKHYTDATTQVLLPTTCHLPPTAYCLLPTTYHRLPTATTYCLLPTPYYLLPLTRVVAASGA